MSAPASSASAHGAVQRRRPAAHRGRPSARGARGWLPSVRQVELGLYALAISGLLLCKAFDVPWSWAGPVLAAHVAGGVVLVAVLVGPFWVQHRRRLETSRRAPARRSGRLSEWLLALLLGSGAYLFLVGNRGGLDGAIAQQLHLWLTFPLLALVGLHMARWSSAARLWNLATSWKARPGRFLA